MQFEMNINACDDDEFSCYDGTCRHREDRCNQISDCEHGEDEENCQKIKLASGYNKMLIPSFDRKFFIGHCFFVCIFKKLFKFLLILLKVE